MSIIVEDGTGVDDANSYVTLVEFQTYTLARQIDIASYSNVQLEAALVVASVDFISVNYDFKGDALSETQGMQLPTNIVSINAAIKNATCSAAVLHLKSRLFVDTVNISNNGTIESESKQVGSLSKEITYRGAHYTNKYPTTHIDKMLSTYTVANGYAPASALRY